MEGKLALPVSGREKAVLLVSRNNNTSFPLRFSLSSLSIAPPSVDGRYVNINSDRNMGHHEVNGSDDGNPTNPSCSRILGVVPQVTGEIWT